jgi:hypothetical protein
MSERHIGRFAVMDGVARRVADDTLRTHVASFHGPSFVAEREGQDLRVHMLDDENGQPVRENVFHHEEGGSGIRSTVGDAGPQSLLELNAMYRRAFPVGIRPRRGGA